MKTAPEDKSVLNPTETIAVFRLSGRKFYQLINSGRKLPFLAFYNKRKLIIRSEFEKYLDENPEVKEGLKNGQPKFVKAARLETPGTAFR